MLPYQIQFKITILLSSPYNTANVPCAVNYNSLISNDALNTAKLSVRFVKDPNMHIYSVKELKKMLQRPQTAKGNRNNKREQEYKGKKSNKKRKYKSEESREKG